MKTLAQAIPARVSFPDWRLPVRVTLRANIGASGAPTPVAAETTPGVSLARHAAGIYNLTFPACRKLGNAPVIICIPDDPTDIADGRRCDIDEANTSATSGNIRFYTRSTDGTEDADEEVVEGSVLAAEFWIDLG